jgi:hypothetical protein
MIYPSPAVLPDDCPRVDSFYGQTNQIGGQLASTLGRKTGCAVSRHSERAPEASRWRSRVPRSRLAVASATPGAGETLSLDFFNGLVEMLAFAFEFFRGSVSDPDVWIDAIGNG